MIPGPRSVHRSEGLGFDVQVRILPTDGWEISAISDSADAEVHADGLSGRNAQVRGDQGAGHRVDEGVALEHLESDRPASGIGFDAEVVLRALLRATGQDAVQRVRKRETNWACSKAWICFTRKGSKPNLE